ncbi:phosphoserine aminotransferase [Marinobacter sp. TBZ242]|uniref:Phosphoserine aminotransferase n=1 Tax=Marinobacter azerbaijanicus TaxID=3050455 RepID=A0ABT7ICF7_9GAMM|nr:phosphoserine aminotransferase [Marinobacter sp. TBZ242]MDL0431400.1 phosphoserine aminotransferase [Marinobacter sp. TBZ242]
MADLPTRPAGAREQAFANVCTQASTPLPAWKRLAQGGTPINCMGLSFPNRLGIAAGFDRTGKLGRRAGNLGFGAIELGSWTRESWPENHPVQCCDAVLDARLGIRLAATTPGSPDHETRQLVRLVERAWLTADYLTLAPDWLQQFVPFQQLHTNLSRLQEAQQKLENQTRKFCPIVFKLRVKPGNQDACNLVPYLASQGVDGILVSFDFGKPVTDVHYRQWQDPGLQATTCRTIEACRRHIKGSSALLTNGGVLSRQNYLDRLSAGADLVQLHNALVFEGPDIGWKLSQ